MQPSLHFLAPFAVASVIGAGFYVLVCLAYEKVPEFVQGVTLPCAILLFFILPTILWVSTDFPFLLIISAASLGGAYADKFINKSQDTFAWHYWKICVSIVATFVDALFLFLIFSQFETTWKIDEPLMVTGIFAGLIAGPVGAPVFIWIYRRLNSFFNNRLLRNTADDSLN